jgi:chromatin structure-remodeling complex subunit RSC1/2
MQQYQTPRPTPGYQQPYMQQPNYKAPQPIETYILNDAANASIPEDIRSQFQRDEKGRVLFFTAPPLNVPQPLSKDGRPLGHSARYLAARAKRAAAKSAKRSADTSSDRPQPAKRAHLGSDAATDTAIAALRTKAVSALETQLATAAKAEFVALYGDDGLRGGVVDVALSGLLDAQAEAARAAERREERLRLREEARRITVSGMTGRLEEKI